MIPTEKTMQILGDFETKTQNINILGLEVG
jgi:hypothetical protein